MNLKDRLIISNQNNVNMQNGSGEYAYTTDEIFSDCKEKGMFIRELILNKRNIVFVHNRDFDSNLFINYIQILMRDKQINLLTNFDESKLINGNINLIKDPQINCVVKILEYIIYGYKPFIFNLCFDSSENITDKISTVISVNYANLSDKNIKTLLFSSKCVFVIIDKKDNSFVISSLFELSDDNSGEMKKLDINDINSISVPYEENNEVSDVDNDLINYDIESHVIEDISVKRKNKCKLLREKARSRHKENI